MEPFSDADAGRPLRVLHVVPYFPPGRIGGVGEVARHVHDGLRLAGHASTVLTSSRNAGSADVVRVAGSAAGFAALAWRHVELTRTVDVVHVHHGEAFLLLLAMKLLRIPTPVVVTLHASADHIRKALGPYQVDGRRLGTSGGSLINRLVTLRLRALLDRLSLALADATTFISRSAARDFLGSGAAASATIIYNGLPDTAAPALTDSPVRDDAPELLYVGTCSVRKRVENLALVLQHVRRSRPRTRLRIVGFHLDDCPTLARLTRELGLQDAIEAVGPVESVDLPPYYAAASVLLVPSAYEGLPMVILEAFQNELPCVATRVSGHPEAVQDGVTGFLVDLDDPGAMADAALRILDDAELRQPLGEQGRALVRRQFRVGTQVQQYIDVYRRVIASARSPAESKRRGRRVNRA